MLVNDVHVEMLDGKRTKEELSQGPEEGAQPQRSHFRAMPAGHECSPAEARVGVTKRVPLTPNTEPRTQPRPYKPSIQLIRYMQDSVARARVNNTA